MRDPEQIAADLERRADTWKDTNPNAARLDREAAEALRLEVAKAMDLLKQANGMRDLRREAEAERDALQRRYDEYRLAAGAEADLADQYKAERDALIAVARAAQAYRLARAGSTFPYQYHDAFLKLDAAIVDLPESVRKKIEET